MSTNFQQTTSFGEEASNLLNFNMESISNELTSLLIGNELEGFGAIGTTFANEASSMPSTYGEVDVVDIPGYRAAPHVNGTVQISAAAYPTINYKDVHSLQQHYNYFQYQKQQQQQLQESQHGPQQQFNGLYNICPANTSTVPQSLGTMDGNTMRPLPQVTQAVTPMMEHSYAEQSGAPLTYAAPLTSSVALSTAPAGFSSSPLFDTYFLCCRNGSCTHGDKKPLIYSALRNVSNTGRDRNFNGRRNYVVAPYGKYNKDTIAGAGEVIDYDKVVVDIVRLGLKPEGGEPNQVLRIFSLLRKMHFYMDEELPSGAEVNDGTIEMLPVKSSMACTMNIQFQVKQAARRCYMFVNDLQCILDTNKVYALLLYLECEQSLNMLRKLLSQFDIFKRCELEHKRGKFLTEQTKGLANCLEKFIPRITDQIREAKIYVHVFNWVVERKFGLNPVISPAATSAITTTPPLTDTSGAQQNLTFENVQNAENNLTAQPIVEDLVAASSINTIKYLPNVEPDAERHSTRYIGYK